MKREFLPVQIFNQLSAFANNNHRLPLRVLAREQKAELRQAGSLMKM